jgi:hypothetical protein
MKVARPSCLEWEGINDLRFHTETQRKTMLRCPVGACDFLAAQDQADERPTFDEEGKSGQGLDHCFSRSVAVAKTCAVRQSEPRLAAI